MAKHLYSVPLLLLLSLSSPVASFADQSPLPQETPSLAKPGTTPARKPNPSLLSVVKTQLPNWDKNKDGKLSREEVDDAVSSTAVRGEAAAAAAALHVYFRDHPKAEALSLAAIGQALQHPQQPGRQDQAQAVPHFEADFHAFLKHIQTHPRELFAENPFRILGVKQGRLGDCYLVSVVGAVVQQQRSRFEQIFHPRTDGGCDLHFPDGTKITVKRLTDAQIALGSSASKQGLWLNILEEGFGQLCVQRFPKQVKPGDIPLDAISRGGHTSLVIEVLTGHRAEILQLQKIAGSPRDINKLRDELIASSKKKMLMTCSTPAQGKVPPGMATRHAYAILGFDADKNLVRIWNPWGNTYQPKVSPPNSTNGYVTRGGRFEVPLDEFVKIFVRVERETSEPLKKTAHSQGHK